MFLVFLTHPGHIENMCRILAVVGDGELKRLAMEAFYPMGQHGMVKPWEDPGHLDGWGATVYDASGIPQYIDRSACNVVQDQGRYALAVDDAEAHPGRLAIVHIRKSTCGVINDANTHPFHSQHWSFCHNGTVQELQRIGEVPPHVGTTDSEALFHLWMARGEPIEKFPAWLHSVADQCPHTSLTSFISDGRKLVATRLFSFDPLDAIPDHYDPHLHMPEYYTLYHWNKRGQHVICSEPLSDLADGWKLIAANDHLCIDV